MGMVIARKQHALRKGSMMLEFGLGFAVGAVITGVVSMFECHRHRVKQTIEQEKDYPEDKEY